MKRNEITQLVKLAKEVRKNAYSPYYNVYVGAALMDQKGKVYVGCNIENAAGPAIACAEANALASAIASGAKKFKAIAVVGYKTKLLYPCGICLQKLSEFAPRLDIYVANTSGKVRHHKLHELLPHPTKL